MAKSSKKQTDWLSKLANIESELDSVLPYFVTAELNVWDQIVVKPETMETARDGGPDGDWSCIRIEMVHGAVDHFYTEEIPFWAMQPFVVALGNADSTKSEIGMNYKRTQSGKKNVAHFDIPA